MEEKKDVRNELTEALRFSPQSVGENCVFGNDVQIGNIDGEACHITIGKNCVIEDGTILIGKCITIGDDVHIGKGCRICGEEINIGDNSLIYDQVFISVISCITLGKRNKISRNCVFRGYSIVFGNELWCNENVDIGGGGCWQNTARLDVGDFVHIGKSAMINVCQPTYIGSRTGIGIESMIFTHSAGNGQSVLDGYAHVEAGVWIGEHVSLYTRAFITPGSRLESGVIIGALAYASGIMEKGLYVGIPARKKREIIVPSLEEQTAVLIKALLSVFSENVSIIHNKELLNDGFNKCILFFDIEHDFVFHDTIMQLREQYQEIVCIVMQPCPIDTNDCANTTLFRLSENDIVGTTTMLSEQVRDFLRRNGILPDFGDYLPHRLDYDALIAKGVER